MAINFPSSPSLGQLYTFAGSTWEWSGEYWEVYSGISSSVVYSITTDTGLSANTITGNVTLLNTLPNYAGGVLTNYSGWTNNGNGTMNLPSVQVALYDNTNFLEPLRVYTVASGVTGSGGISGLTDNDTNYIYIEYNNGSPRWVVSTDNSAINGSTVVRFQNVYRIGNFIHNLEWGNEGAGLPNKIANRIDSVDRFARESGLSLGLSGSTGVVTLSSGVAWNGTLRQSLDPVNSQTDIFFQNFHSGGTWVISTTADTLNNTYYDDGTDRVVASAGTYLVNWYYRGQEINDHLYEVWGNTAYTSVAAAQLSLEPALPELITSHAFLLGRIIVQQGALTGFVETAFVTPFQPSTVQNHNDLTGLQGGSAGQYYHLDANQYNNIALTNTNNNFSSSQTINGNLNVTGDTTLNNLTANTISATTISGGTFYGDGGNLTNIVISVSATTGLSGDSTTGNITLINTAPDQTVTISGGTNIEISGSYPNFGVNFTGTTGVSGDFLPLSGGTVTGDTIFQSGLTANTISATNFSGGNFTGNGSGLTDVVLSISATTGLSGNSTTGNITLVNTAPDQIVTITGGTNIEISGSYPDFGVNFTGQTEFPYLPLSGGTVTGDTIFQSGLTANTISATTISGGTLYGDGSNLTNVDNIYTVDGVLTGNRTLSGASNDLNFADLNVFRTSEGGNDRGFKLDFVNDVYDFGGFGDTQININSLNGVMLLGDVSGLTNGTKLHISDVQKSIKTIHNGSDVGLKLNFASQTYQFGQITTGNTTHLSIDDLSQLINTSHYGGGIGLELDFFNLTYSLGDYENASGGTKVVLDDSAKSISTFVSTAATPALKIFSSGNISINNNTDVGNKLYINSISDPVRFDGLQVLNTDTQVVTTDTNGVLHKRTYDYVTGFTYASSSNTFTIKTSSGTTFNASINQMSGLTIDGDLTVLGDYVVSGDTIISGNTIFSGTTTLQSVPNAIGNFLTLPSGGTVSKRTSDQVRDDIGYYGLTFAIMNGYY